MSLPLLTSIAKTPKEFVIIDDPIMVKDYDSSQPRADQIKARAKKLGEDLIKNIKALDSLLTNPAAMDVKAVYSLCAIEDDRNFILTKYLYKIEYNRLDFDSFGRVRRMNDDKRKYLWFSTLVIKFFIYELLGNFSEQMGEPKIKREVLLACRLVASVLYHCAYEVIKRGMRIISNNDTQLEEKPETRDNDQIDKSLKLQKWKGKKSGEEQPAIRDVLEIDQLNVAMSTKFQDAVIVISC